MNKRKKYSLWKLSKTGRYYSVIHYLNVKCLKHVRVLTSGKEHQGVGANAIAAQAVEHVPKALLQATMAGGAMGAAMMPKVNPAAA